MIITNRNSSDYFRRINLICLLLSAGEGTRLRPYTNNWPKCLMPIQGRPLLSYWLTLLTNEKVQRIYVNTSFLSEIVEEYICISGYKKYVNILYEKNLKGTAGTLRDNYESFNNSLIFLAHADNLCVFSFRNFVQEHLNNRPKHCKITMMTFNLSSIGSLLCIANLMSFTL